MQLHKFTLKKGTTLREAISVIDRGAIQFAIVVDENNRLVGTITDGDVRRGLLRGVSLDDSVELICNTSPVTGSISDDQETLNKMMLKHELHHIPVLDEKQRVFCIKYIDDLLLPKKRENLAIVMAGGAGKRLRPLTEKCPKPLLRIGGKPILENIIMNFAAYGFYKILVCVNYKADMIRKYFEDGSKWGAKIQYIEESEPKGTAGALSLLEERPEQPIFVMNGDLLTNVNFLNLMEYHEQQHVVATMCVSEYSFEVPFGVVHTDEHRIMDIQEKPTHCFFVNAGIYVLNPECLKVVPKDRYYDMPDLFRELIRRNDPVCSFPLREYWIDIGQMSDFERANSDYRQEFVKKDC